MNNIATMLQSAKAAGILNPRLHFGRFLFKLAKETSNNPGCVYVTLKDTGDYIGKISPQYLFYPIRGIHQDCLEEVLTAMKDPLEAAKLHAQRTGKCCACGRTLFNGVSIAAMIGPICSEKYGFDQLEIALANGYTKPLSLLDLLDL